VDSSVRLLVRSQTQPMGSSVAAYGQDLMAADTSPTPCPVRSGSPAGEARLALGEPWASV